MSWSIPLGRVFGSEIRIHLTFLILLGWIGAAGYAEGGPSGALDGMAFTVAVFACVTLHELGHAVAARRYGIATPDITLLPIGGLARLARMPERPSEEIVIALAGPAVNVVIFLALALLAGATPDPGTMAGEEAGPAPFADRLAAVNLFLVVFNLIPAFPMDGGRVLRAALSIRLGRRRATEIAALIGQGTAFVFGALGLFGGNAILVFIAIFVYLAASAEAGQTGLMERARHTRTGSAMVSRFEALGSTDTVDDAAAALLRTTQREFPVLDADGRLEGFLTRDAMIAALRERGPATPVASVLLRGVPTVRASDRLETALKPMQEAGAAFVAVVDDGGRLVGYVSPETISELMMLDAADWPGSRRHPAVGPTGPRTR